MRLPRRSLLLAAAAPWAGRAGAAAPALRLEPAGEGLAALTGPDVRRPLLLPETGARLLPWIVCGGETLAVAAFRQEDCGSVLEWAALALLRDHDVALLALEPLAWRGADGTRMTTRPTTGGDRLQVILHRDFAVQQSPTLWRREAWTDYLAWAAPAGLVDAPVRAPLAGTRQSVVALWRRRAFGLVATAPGAVTPALLAASGLQAGVLWLA